MNAAIQSDNKETGGVSALRPEVEYKKNAINVIILYFCISKAPDEYQFFTFCYLLSYK